MPRLRGRSKQVFDACCVEIHRMFSGEISEAELARRSVEIAERFGLSINWAGQRRSESCERPLLADEEEVRING
ncbi:MAG: hypothetical protein GXX08_13675 [Firmicutes bacterium]|nr:hypothetical protein [Bacillota bacterium]